jgi:hypothetical protein
MIKATFLTFLILFSCLGAVLSFLATIPFGRDSNVVILFNIFVFVTFILRGVLPNKILHEEVPL